MISSLAKKGEAFNLLRRETIYGKARLFEHPGKFMWSDI
jgi:hypothetical protein